MLEPAPRRPARTQGPHLRSSFPGWRRESTAPGRRHTRPAAIPWPREMPGAESCRESALSALPLPAPASRIFSGRNENRPGPSRKPVRQESRMAARHSILYFAAEQIGVADELRGIGGCRPVVNLPGRRDLFQFSHAQQRDAVGHDHGFFLVMSNEHEGDSDFALQRFQFHLHLAAEVGVERGERLVQQQQPGTVHQGAGQGDALLLSAADLCRFGRRRRQSSSPCPMPAPLASRLPAAAAWRSSIRSLHFPRPSDAETGRSAGRPY